MSNKIIIYLIIYLLSVVIFQLPLPWIFVISPNSQRMTYIEDVSNYLEWVCYITAILYCIPPCDCRAGFKQEVGAIALFFGWMNLILYFRR